MFRSVAEAQCHRHLFTQTPSALQSFLGVQWTCLKGHMNGCVCTGQESLAERDHASFYLKEATRFCSKYGKDLILEYQAYMWCIDIHVRKTPIYTK